MSNRKILIQHFAEDQQITIDGVVQITACADGRIVIDIPGDGIEVEQSPNSNRLVITRKPDPAAANVEATPGLAKTRVMRHLAAVSTLRE